MKNIVFQKIKVSCSKAPDYQEQIEIFKWRNEPEKKINIFYYANACGKTTLFNIIYDLVQFGEKKIIELFSEELFVRRIEAEVEFSIDGHLFKIERNYFKDEVSAYHIFDNNELEIKDKEVYREILEKILDIPKNIDFLGKNQISFFSLLKLHFVDDEHYNKEVLDKYSYCNLSNQKFDSIKTPLLYFYIFNCFSDDLDLQEAYDIGGEFRELNNKKKNYQKIIALKDENSETQKSLFDTSHLLKKGEEITKKSAYKNIEIYNYQKATSILNNILEKLKKADESSSENEEVRAWIDAVSTDLSTITERIEKIEKIEIPNLQQELRHVKKEERELNEFKNQTIEDNFKVFKKINNLDSVTYLNFRKEYEKLKTEVEDRGDQYAQIAARVDGSSSLRELNGLINELLSNEISVEFSPQRGKIKVDSLSDSKNRIARFVTLGSFLFLKNIEDINHFGFVFSDSPFIGVSSANIQKILDTLIEKMKNVEFDSQVFLFLNKDSEGEFKDLFEKNEDLIHLVDEGDKVFTLPE